MVIAAMKCQCVPPRGQDHCNWQRPEQHPRPGRVSAALLLGPLRCEQNFGRDQTVLYSKANTHDFCARPCVGMSPKRRRKHVAGVASPLRTKSRTQRLPARVHSRDSKKHDTSGDPWEHILLVMTEFIKTAIRVHGVDGSTLNIAQSIRHT